MKKLDDIIEVNLNHMGMKTVANGKITYIDHNKVTIQTAHTVFLDFDALTGEIITEDDGDWATIDIVDIDVPENPFNSVKYRMYEEGFHYCFTNFSKWENVKDLKFQRLKKEYLKTAKKLEDFINEKADY